MVKALPRTNSVQKCSQNVLGVKSPLPYSTIFEKKQIMGVIVIFSETSGDSRGLTYTHEGVL